MELPPDRLRQGYGESAEALRERGGGSYGVRYTAAVHSVADDLRAESRQRGARMTPAERFQLALTLGDADVELLAAARTLSRDEAIEVIRRTRWLGRRRSVSSEGRRP